MAKKGMNLKYKKQKRERNKYNPEKNNVDSAKSFIINLLSVLLFMGLMYLIVLGLQKLGLFQAGYTAPTKDATTISYEYIPASTVFNRNESSYYVIFDNYESNFSYNSYVDYLLDKKDNMRVYKVDMSVKENARFKGEIANSSAKNVNELSIDDITLIRITNGKIAMYLTGSEKIEEYLEK